MKLPLSSQLRHISENRKIGRRFICSWHKSSGIGNCVSLQPCGHAGGHTQSLDFFITFFKMCSAQGYRSRYTLRRTGALLLLSGVNAASTGPSLLDPVHVFNLKTLGLNDYFEKEKIADSFDNLVPDAVSVDANGASMHLQRERRYAAFDVYISRANHQELTNVTYREGVTSFAQTVDDFRNATRTFEPLEPDVRDSMFLHNFIKTTCSWAAASMFGPHSTNIRANVSVHQVRQVARPGVSSDNAPEGVHRDGADFIVSALVLNKRNILGGRSTVFSPDKQEVLLEHTLEAGEGIFHEDRELWHDITKVHVGPGEEFGFRDIIGLDIIMSKDGLGYGRGCAE